MKILTAWLRLYLPSLAVSDRQLADDLTLRGIAVEGVHDLGAPASGHLFEMDITTNRVDAMNHYGIAREAATIYDLPLSPLLPEPPQQRASAPSQPLPVRIDPAARHLCGRFTAQVLRNVTIAPGTGQVAEYFALLGQKQISNAVDASNFTLLGMGHPTHAFDLDKIEGGIVVRLARRGEKLKLLDGTDRTLEPDDLVIADERKALSLAGVMGGFDSMITPGTKNILIESAWFDPATIRRSSRRHGLHTDASHRFERGADFNAAPIANRLVAALILQAGGYPEGDLIDILDPATQARTASRPPIALSVHEVQRHLGATLQDTPASNHTPASGHTPTQSALTPHLIAQYLTALGCTLHLTHPNTSTPNPPVVPAPDPSGSPSPKPLGSPAPDPSGSAAHRPLGSPEPRLPGAPSVAVSSPRVGFEPPSTFQVHLPSWRLDLEREIDLIEEIARVYGYNRFANTLPTPLPVLAHPAAAAEHAVRTRLLALGYSEAISSTFASPQDAALFAPATPTLAMENPLSEEASLLRPSLLPGMTNMLAHNLNRDVRTVRLFEQGQIFTGSPASVDETPTLSLGLTSSTPASSRLYSPQDAPIFELKGVLESLASLFSLPGGPEALTFSTTPPPAAPTAPDSGAPRLDSEMWAGPPPNASLPTWLEPGRGATLLLNDQPLAHFGELSRGQRDARKLRQPVFLAQLDLAPLYALPLRRVTAHDLSRFQAVERDFSFTFPDTTHWHTLASALHALSIPELQRLTPEEIFRDPKGKAIPVGFHSLLLRLVFQSHDRTLRDDELSAWSTRIIETLTALGGTLRA